MQRTKPPFRADEVGSLLRPAKIKEARAKLEKGEISADDLRKIEDMEIEKVVHKQASVGSSSSSTLGLSVSARPIASICCSPPESWLPKLLRRSFSRGNIS